MAAHAVSPPPAAGGSSDVGQGAAGNESFRATLVQLLGGVRTRSCPLDARVESEMALTNEETPSLAAAGAASCATDSSITRQRVTYCVEPGDRIGAYLLLPAGARAENAGSRKWPAVLAHHQHNNEFHIGKSEVVGITGNPQQAYGLELARRGYIVLAPDALCFEERGPYGRGVASAQNGAAPVAPSDDAQLAGFALERHEFNARLAHGECLQTKYVSDMVAGMDYLCSHPLVDDARIGAIGHSLGGQQSLFLAAIDDRVRAAVSSCGFSSIAAILRERINHNCAAYVPRLLRFGDLGDVLASVAPRAFMALNGGADAIFPNDGALRTVETAQQRFAAAGAEEKLRFRLYQGQGHEFTDETRETAYAFLDEHLKQ